MNSQSRLNYANLTACTTLCSFGATFQYLMLFFVLLSLPLKSFPILHISPCVVKSLNPSLYVRR